MTIRITKTVDESLTVLKVDGWLRADDVQELSRARRSVNGEAALDLSELHSADREGVATLRELISLGTAIRRASPYIELLLKVNS